LSLAIVVIIIFSTIPLLKESSKVLMQNIPDDYDVEELKNNLMKAVPEILDIHEVFSKSTTYVLK
jgi:zinc transporter 1